ISASMVSQIETGKSRPSVSTLYAMTTALGLSIEDVFSQDVARDSAWGAVLPLQARSAAVAAGDVWTPPASRSPPLGPLVRPEERPCLTLDTGVTWERLGQLPGQSADFLLITYPSG